MRMPNPMTKSLKISEIRTQNSAGTSNGRRSDSMTANNSSAPQYEQSFESHQVSHVMLSIHFQAYNPRFSRRFYDDFDLEAKGTCLADV